MPRQSWFCVVFLTYKPSPFSSFTGKITARLLWNIWTGTAYFTLLLIFDRCSGKTQIHINWSHMHIYTWRYTALVCCTAVHKQLKTFCADKLTRKHVITTGCFIKNGLTMGPFEMRNISNEYLSFAIMRTWIRGNAYASFTHILL